MEPWNPPAVPPKVLLQHQERIPPEADRKVHPQETVLPEKMEMVLNEAVENTEVLEQTGIGLTEKAEQKQQRKNPAYKILKHKTVLQELWQILTWDRENQKANNQV